MGVCRDGSPEMVQGLGLPPPMMTFAVVPEWSCLFTVSLLLNTLKAKSMR